MSRLNRVSYYRIIHARLVRLAIIAHSPQNLDYDKAKTYFTGGTAKGKMKIKESHVSRRHTLTEEYATLKQWWDNIRPKLEEWEAELLERFGIMPDLELVRWCREELKEDWDVDEMRKRCYKIAAKLKRQEDDLEREEKRQEREKKKRREDVWERAREYAKNEKEFKESLNNVVNRFVRLPKLF